MYNNYKIGWSNYDKKRWLKCERLLIRDLFEAFVIWESIKWLDLPISNVISHIRRRFQLIRWYNSMTNSNRNYFHYLSRQKKNR